MSIEILIYKMICSNGMLLGGGRGQYYFRRHVGLTREDFVAEIGKTFDELPTALEYVREQIVASKKAMLNSKGIQTLIDQFKEKVGVSDTAVDKLLSFVPKYGENVWGVANAITELAQEFSLQRQQEFERYAGVLISKASKIA